MLVCVRGQAPGGGLQRGCGVVGERLAVAGEHLRLAPAGDGGRGADVITVEVGQHQPPQVCGLPSALADRVGGQGRS